MNSFVPYDVPTKEPEYSLQLHFPYIIDLNIELVFSVSGVSLRPENLNFYIGN